MTDIIISVLNMSAAASVAAASVLLARLPLRKAPKIFSYALWAVVFIRLVCPVSFESPASLMPVGAEIITRASADEPSSSFSIGGTGEVNPPPLASLHGETAAPHKEPAVSVSPERLAMCVGTAVWLLGIAALLTYAVVGYVRLKRRVYDATVESGNVYRTDKIPTAFVLGFVRPRIYVPLNIQGAQFEHIIKHEQAHIRRLDYLIKPLAFLIFTLHWFNPVVWISYYLMSKDMEMSCDEAVLRRAGSDLRKAYSMSLVNLYTRKQALLSPLAFGEGSYKNMKERIKNVLNFKKAPRWVVAVCSLALVIFTVGFTTNPPRNVSADAAIENAALATPQPAAIVEKTADSGPASDENHSTADAPEAESEPKATTEPLNNDPVTTEQTVINVPAQNIKTVALTIDSCNVAVLASDDERIKYESDETLHTVTVAADGSDLSITVERIAGEASTSPLTDMVTVYLPGLEYESITADISHAGLALPAINSNLYLTSNNGAMSVEIPEGFNKTVELTNNDGAGSLEIHEGARDYVLNIRSEHSIVSASEPYDFPALALNRAQAYQYQDGNGTAKININVTNGVFSIKALTEEAENTAEAENAEESATATSYGARRAQAWAAAHKPAEEDYRAKGVSISLHLSGNKI